MSPKLSIIIPVYNTEPYLRECLDSVINQTFKDIEIIIVNDCSPDNSEDIILEYQQKDPRIIYIKHDTNLGLGGARNTGIKNATGEWITFVDSDDFIELHTYTHMMTLILQHKVNLGVFSAINFDHLTKKQSYKPFFDTDISTPTKINHQNFNIIQNPTVWSKIYKLSDLIKNNIWFPNYLKHEDEEFWFKYRVIVEPTIIGCNEKFYHYRQRSNSITQNTSFKKDYGYISKNIYDFLIANNKFNHYQEYFLQFLQIFTLIPDIDIDTHIKLLTIIKALLKSMQLPNQTLIDYRALLYLQNIQFIDDNTILFFTDINRNYNTITELSNDKWYQFGQLSRKQKIKFIIKKILKKIFMKLHLFHIHKSFKIKYHIY